MHIYLVCIRQRADESLFLEYKETATTGDDYIAISHVWGTPETITPTQVDGAGIVQLSPGKKDILSILRREDVCGENWFWMDLFCIDQKETASISITDQLMAIPIVYKSSRCQGPARVPDLRCLALFRTSRFIRSGGRLGRGRLPGGGTLALSTLPPPAVLRSLVRAIMLWTRQEGLYGAVLEIIVLNPISCKRLQTVSEDRAAGWVAHGSLLAKRTVAESFLYDKLSYHGVSLVNAEREHLNMYLDLVYRRRFDISKYGGMRGPYPTYSPILEAWRSRRATTKQRDYVLAVFPDINGYVVPPAARKKAFLKLFTDALGQAPIRALFDIVSKVPRGVMIQSKSLKDSMGPWVFPQPENVGEAYDTCVLWLEATLEDVELSLSGVPSLQELCARSMDAVKHMALISLTGPCGTGTTREDVGMPRGLVQQYLVHQFAPVAVAQHLPTGGMGSFELRSTGIISFNAINDVAVDVFNEELRGYLVCMLCGTSLRTADTILTSASLRLVSTHLRLMSQLAPFTKLLALLRLEELQGQ